VAHCDTRQVLTKAVDAAESFTNSSIGFFYIVEDDQTSISLRVWSTRARRKMSGLPESVVHRLVDNKGAWLNCIREQRTVILNSFSSSHDKAGGEFPVRQIIVPVKKRQRVVAVMGLGNQLVDYNDRDALVLTRVAETAFDAIERQETDRRIEYMAYHDGLTGLPNRQLLIDRLGHDLARARRTQDPVLVCYLDIDDFKTINERFGHEVGDRLLKQLADRLTAQLREGDTLGRWGGDEFVLVLNGMRSTHDCEEIIERVLNSVRAPIRFDDVEIQMSGCIGATFSQTTHPMPMHWSVMQTRPYTGPRPWASPCISFTIHLSKNLCKRGAIFSGNSNMHCFWINWYFTTSPRSHCGTVR
jgi:diguanylate cyclase (GGDEF)-like protein